jgi:hypothetical protein
LRACNPLFAERQFPVDRHSPVCRDLWQSCGSDTHSELTAD